MNAIYDTLNDKQQEAVFHTDGPLLILAGAGSGKTRALTHRIAYLIEEKKVAPWNILAITFTNKAAGEMRERVNTLVTCGAEKVWVSTFHSLCVRILRREAERIGYDRNFSIYDADDQKALVRQIIRQMNLDPKKYPEKRVISVISRHKDELKTPQDYEREAIGDAEETRLAGIYREYQTQLFRNNAFDFDDLIMKTVEILRDFEEAREYWSGRFRYILVDEYQDTNAAQFHLVQKQGGPVKNLCVVGDDDQSIYKFRGANIQNILNFETYFPDAAVIKLEQNYRSTQNILDVANEVIRHNEGRTDKRLWTANGKGNKVRYRVYSSGYQEADEVIDEIRKLCRKDLHYQDCAILYRTNAQSRLFEEACVRTGIPYRLVGGINFYQRKEIKDILAYLKTVDNAQDDLAVQRIVNLPRRGIGQATVNKAMTFALANDLPLFDAMERADRIPGMGKAAMRLRPFVELIHSYREKEEMGISIAELIEEILDSSGYNAALDEEEDPAEAEARRANLNELIAKAADYEKGTEETSLSGFLEDVSLVADIDTMDESEDRVTLMTLHGAKGLEFPRVYMVGMEDGLFPGSMVIRTGRTEDMEEERRLFYVGVTRAMYDLTLTGAVTRRLGNADHSNRSSRFLTEIPAELLDMGDDESRMIRYEEMALEHYGDEPEDSISPDVYRLRRNLYRDHYDEEQADRYARGEASRDEENGASSNSFRRSGAAQAEGSRPPRASHGRPRSGVEGGFGSLSAGNSIYLGSQMVRPEEGPDYRVGDRVKHRKFGEGTVQEITEQPRDYEVTVDFDRFGVKKMYATFAKLERISEE